MNGCWHYVDVHGREEQTEMKIAVHNMNTEYRHQVAAVRSLGDHDVVTGKIPGLVFG